MQHCKHPVALMLWTFVLLAGCEQSSDAPVEMAEGQEPYLRYCASCHGNQGQGKPPAFPPLAGSEWLDQPPEALAIVVLAGLRGEIEVAGERYRGFMPPMRHLSDDDIAAIVGFLKDRWADGGEHLDAAQVAAVREVVAGRRPVEGREDLERSVGELP